MTSDHAPAADPGEVAESPAACGPTSIHDPHCFLASTGRTHVSAATPAARPAADLFHNHPPYRPMCNEREVDGQLRGACLNDDGTPAEALPLGELEALADALRFGVMVSDTDEGRMFRESIARRVLASDWLAEYVR